MSFLDLPPFSLFSAHQIFEFPYLPDSVTALLRHIVKLQNKNNWEVKHKVQTLLYKTLVLTFIQRSLNT